MVAMAMGEQNSVGFNLVSRRIRHRIAGEKRVDQDLVIGGMQRPGSMSVPNELQCHDVRFLFPLVRLARCSKSELPVEPIQAGRNFQ